MLKYNYHTHTRLCNHATGDVMDYVKFANENGYIELGFSDHGPIQNINQYNEDIIKNLYLDENMTINDFYNIYLNDIDNAKLMFPSINILKGLEVEYLNNDEYLRELKENLDYLILGVHFYISNDKLIDTYSKLTENEIYEYVSTIEKALDTGLFKILAHPDLFLYSNNLPNYMIKECASRIENACIRNDVLLEINCNGNGKYPYLEFFKYIKNAKCIIGVDAHNPNRLKGVHIEEAIKLAKALELDVVERLEL